MYLSKIPDDEGRRWRQIALIWAKVATVPLTQPDRAMRLLMSLTIDVLGATYAWVVLSVRSDDEVLRRKFGEAGAWVPVATMSLDESVVKPEVDLEFFKKRLNKDTWTAGRLKDAGKHRTHRRVDILGDAPWSSCETGWHLEQYNVSDRMIAVHALSDDVEFHIGVDRVGDPEFSAKEQAWLHDLNLGLTPFCARLAMSFGLLVNETMLTPRERETLLHLLDGESEAVIAHEMGLSRGTVHQYIVTIFRKLGVNSRSELMTKWMNTGASEGGRAAIERELAETLVPHL